MKSGAKRIVLVLLAGILALGLVACALEPEEAAPAKTAAKTTANATTAAVTTAATTEAEPETIELRLVEMNAQNADYDKSGEATLDSKYQKLAAAISEKSPDLVFLIEVNTLSSTEGIRKKMANASTYASVYEDNATTMMLYNKEVFTLLGKGSKRIGAPGDADGSKYERYLVWVELLHKESGEKFVVVPLHVDYVTKACKAQINRIVSHLKDNFANHTFILGGDFNAEYGTISATSLTTEGYVDARSTAAEKIHGDEKTYPKNSQILDYVWYKTKNGLTAETEKYEVITTTLPTDHRPIYVELSFTK